jgi:Contractile injection system tube protein/LysM domain
VTGKLEKAFLALHKPKNKGRAMDSEYDRISFTFNPKELSITRTADWKTSTSKKPQPPEYNGAKGGTVSLEMFLDASEGGTVQPTVDKLLAAVLPAQGTDTKQKPVAPYVSFGWGSATYVACSIVKSVAAKYTRFNSDGSAIRAVVTITLEEVMPSLVRQNPTSGALGAESVHLYRTGDTLAGIATAELGSPNSWRAIAQANGIDDPFRVRAGRRLIVPTVGTL